MRDVLLTAAVAVAVNVLSQRALALTSPLFMSVGFAASIPAATLTDVVFRQVALTRAAGAGMLLILLSQLLMAACADRAGDVAGSIARFDDARDAQPSLDPYLWQRGLSLYYAKRYADGAAQFRRDVAVNPNDTEEQIWHLLCLAQVKDGLAAARQSALTVGTDRRPVMRAAQALFLGKTDASALQAFTQGNSGDGDKFYANLYLGLYGEATGDAAEARKRISQSVAGRYAQGPGASDPMVELAKVHLQRRGWLSGKAEL